MPNLTHLSTDVQIYNESSYFLNCISDNCFSINCDFDIFILNMFMFSLPLLLTIMEPIYYYRNTGKTDNGSERLENDGTQISIFIENFPVLCFDMF